MNLDSIKNMEKNDFLNMVGLETRRNSVDYLVPVLAIFGVGVLVGTGIGLLVAPKPGRELREDIAKGIQQAPDALARLPQRATDAMHRVQDQVAARLPDGKITS